MPKSSYDTKTELRVKYETNPFSNRTPISGKFQKHADMLWALRQMIELAQGDRRMVTDANGLPVEEPVAEEPPERIIDLT